MRALSGSLVAALALIWGVGAAAQPLAGQPMQLMGRFAGELTKKGQMKPVPDLSGVACAPQAGGVRRCLFVSDENGFAQFATIAGTKITPDPLARPLLKATGAPVGTPPVRPAWPTGGCNAVADPKPEIDAEGVAFAAPAYFVVGSHGCSRGKGDWRPSQMALYRLNANRTIDATWQLNKVLQAAGAPISDHYGRKLDAATDGLTIEGLAADGDRLWIGLRAPVAGNGAALLSVETRALFNGAASAADLKPAVVRLKLGPKVGVRDLAWLAPRQLLVLAGPAQNPPGTRDFVYQVYLVDLSAGCRAGLLADLAPIDGTPDEDDLKAGLNRVQAKAEGLAWLGGALGDMKLLVTYDKANQGMPHVYTVKARPKLSAGLCVK